MRLAQSGAGAVPDAAAVPADDGITGADANPHHAA
jgi:hypothetical protein